MLYSLLSALLLYGGVGAVGAEDPWSFIVSADWHGAESFAVRQNVEDDENFFIGRDIFRSIREEHNAELLMLPGDTQTGHWYESWFNEWLEEEMNLTGLSVNETIRIGADNCYSAARKLFREAGFDKVLLAFGDHELGGNPWQPDTSKVAALPIFREGLIAHFNRKENGDFIFDDPIGAASARPLGTRFENTSFAHVHKNALFITVDTFYEVPDLDRGRYFDRQKSTGGEGIITGTVAEEHLAWFESVLIEARKIESIKHTFVQAHVPILQPVRKTDCSGQFFDLEKNSDFWKLMQAYNVDVYFAGEVHANTVTKDLSTDLLQVVTRGNRINNYLAVTVQDDGFSMSSFNEYGPKWRFNGMYEKYGELVVTKSRSTSSIDSSGSLELLDISKGPLIQLNFEEKETYPFRRRQIVGMKHDQFKQTLTGQNITIRNVTSDLSMENAGVFGQQYDAQIANLGFDSTNAITGKTSGVFSDDTRVAIYGMGPWIGGEVISTSIFFRTSKSKEMILIFYGGVFGTIKRKDIFLLTLKRGNPRVYFGKNRFLTTADDLNLDDGVWHHLAISMPYRSCLSSEVQIFVNGNSVPTTWTGKDEHIFYTTSGKMSVGGFGYSNAKYESQFPNLNNFDGMMDNLRIWEGYSISAQLLGQAMKKNFETHAVKCKYSSSRKNKKMKTAKKCRKICLRQPHCWGYELRDKIDNKYQCFNFIGKRPELGEATKEINSCHPAIR